MRQFQFDVKVELCKTVTVYAEDINKAFDKIYEDLYAIDMSDAAETDYRRISSVEPMEELPM